MRLRLIPREERFFDMFAEDVANVLGAARLLEAMLRSYDAIERAGAARSATPSTAATRSATRSATGSRRPSSRPSTARRSTPSSAASTTSSTTSRRSPTRSSSTTSRRRPPVAIEQAAIIVRQCEQLHEALTHLRGFKDLEKYWIEVHRLENEGDQLARKAIADLFSDGGDPLEVIKWKEIYGLLEATIDKCEDVANIIERITIKHA